MNRSIHSWLGGGVTLLLLSAGACKDPAAPPPEGGFAAVARIFAKRCSGSTCHVGATVPEADLDLTYCSLVGAPAFGDNRLIRVEPGSPDQSYLFCKLDPNCCNLDPECCDADPNCTLGAGRMMPIGSDGLPEAEREIIRSWIAEGAPPPPGMAACDRQPPMFAGLQSGESLPGGRIRLTWPAAADDRSPAGEISYEIYWAPVSGRYSYDRPLAAVVGQTSVEISGFGPDRTYFFTALAADAEGNKTAPGSGEVMVSTVDVAAPVFAGADGAEAADANAVRVFWLPAADDFDPPSTIRYRVFLSTAPGVFGLQPTATIVGSSEIVLDGLMEATTYYVGVRALDSAGNQDGNTREVQVRTVDGRPPIFGGVASVSPAGAGALSATWTPATDNGSAPAEIRYRVYVATSAGGQSFASPTMTTTPGATLATVTGLADSTLYYVVVRAVDVDGNEDQNTVERSARTTDGTPPVFGGATSASADPGSITVSWSPAQDNLTPASQIVYLVYQAATPGGENFAAPTKVTAPGVDRVAVGGLATNATYYFVVRARDADANIDGNTSEVSARTPRQRDIFLPFFGGLETATPLSPSEVRLAWSAATDDISPSSEIVYNVYAATISGGQNFGSPMLSTGPGATGVDVGGLIAGTRYYFVVRAQDQAGNEENNTAERSAETVGDANPPTFGGAKQAVALSDGEISVSWDPASDDTADASAIEYLVYAATSPGAQTFNQPSAVSAAGATATTVSGLMPASTYYLVVRARDPSGNVDGNTVEVSATTGADRSPPVFAGASAATAIGAGSVEISWSPATDNLTPPEGIVYLVYQATSPGAQSFAVPTYTTAAGATSFVASGLDPGTSYYFVVRARDAAGNIDTNTREVLAGTGADRTPPTFAGVSGAQASVDRATLSWSPATDDTSAPSQIVYLIYQATTSGGQNFSSPVATTAAGATTYTVAGLAGSTTYYFVVRARDAAGNVDTNTVERSATTSQLSFAVDIVGGIFTHNRTCTEGGSCHAGALPARGLNLSTASSAYAGLVNVAIDQSPACSFSTRVVPGNPDQSFLLAKLVGPPAGCGSQMPKAGVSLTSTQISLIRNWILQGAPNN